MTKLTVDGTPVEFCQRPLWWHEHGLNFTASGYGRRIPLTYMVRWNNRWRRVYCCIFSNSGTCYIEGPRDPITEKRTWLYVDGY